MFRTTSAPGFALRVAALGAALLAPLGCGGLGLDYLTQAGWGQLALSRGAVPIAQVAVDPKVPPRTRALLSEMEAVKRFGEARGLRPTLNYTEYVHLDRPAVVWVVSACAPLAFRPKVWSFPLVGSFTYVGWFAPERAEQHAAAIRQTGLDVDVRGSSAYSTLGWFRDPILSTMVSSGDDALGDLVNVVLHESVHATFYVNSQSYLNESLASFVADALTPEYLRAVRGPYSRELRAYQWGEREGLRRQQVFHRVYLALERLYAAPGPSPAKLAEKARLLAELKETLHLAREVNNATLIQYRTYGVGREEFAALLDACGGEWPRFWSALAALSPRSFSKPQQEDLSQVILPLAARGCPVSAGAAR